MSVEPSHNQIVHLAYTISEADNQSIPVLLLTLKDILESNTGRKDKIALISEIWKYEFPSMILSALQLDYSLISSSWLTACQLTSVLVECCIGYPSKKRWIEDNFLKSCVMTILQNISKMTTDFNKAERLFKDNLLANLSLMLSVLSTLMEEFSLLTYSVMSSKHFMQLLMMDDQKLSLVALSFLKNVITINRSVFDHVNDSRVHSIADELAFKISSTSDNNIARISLSLLLVLIDLHCALLDLFASKRYRGFKLYLNKWFNKGFDSDIIKLSNILDAQSEEQKITRKHYNAAIMIQSFYRGYRERKELRKANVAFSKLQRAFREKRRRRIETMEKKVLARKRRDYVETKRRKEFVGSRTKQLHIIEKIPAKTVTHFLYNLQHESAKKIQAAWRGQKTRRLFKYNKPMMKVEKAVIIIQRRIRKWLSYRRQKRSAILDLVPDGLTDARKVELQDLITKIRERFPAGSVTDDDLYKNHEKAFRMLNNHVISLRQIRRRDGHRKALLAQLSIQREEMSTMPSLDVLNNIDMKHYTSHSTPIMVAARKKHFETLRDLKKPWWKTLNDAVVAGSEEMDYECNYVQDHEKQF